MSCEVWIVSWTGQHDNAAHIQAELDAVGASTRVIWSDRNEGLQRSGAGWLQVPNAKFLGSKFETILSHLDSDVLLMITADARHRRWASLYAQCIDAFARYPHLGIWSPIVDFSPWRIDMVKVANLPGTSLVKVVQTDSIVWALSRPVIDRLRGLDYSGNNLGWGIDALASAYCHANGLLVAMDTSVHVDHPKGTAYNTELADRQFKTFLAQLTGAERRVLQELQSRIRMDRVAAPPGRNDPCLCGSGRKYKQCCGRNNPGRIP